MLRKAEQRLACRYTKLSKRRVERGLAIIEIVGLQGSNCTNCHINRNLPSGTGATVRVVEQFGQSKYQNSAGRGLLNRFPCARGPESSRGQACRAHEY